MSLSRTANRGMLSNLIGKVLAVAEFFRLFGYAFSKKCVISDEFLGCRVGCAAAKPDSDYLCRDCIARRNTNVCTDQTDCKAATQRSTALAWAHTADILQ